MMLIPVGNGFPPLSHSPPFGFVAATPPRMFHADVFDHVVVTLGPQHIEEDVSNSVRKISIGHLEAGSKPANQYENYYDSLFLVYISPKE